MNNDNLPAAEYLRRLPEDAESQEALRRARECLRQYGEAMASPEFRAGMATLKAAYETRFGEPMVEVGDLEEWVRQAVRFGVPVDHVLAGRWTAAEFAPVIQGGLLKLKDKREAAQAAGAGAEHDRQGKKQSVGGNSSPGGAPQKILAALLKHHEYDSQSCLIFDPIGTRELAEKASVSAGSVSSFWKDKFGADGQPGSHDAYCRSCVNGRLSLTLALLNGDMPPSDVLQGIRDGVRREMEDE